MVVSSKNSFKKKKILLLKNIGGVLFKILKWFCRLLGVKFWPQLIPRPLKNTKLREKGEKQMHFISAMFLLFNQFSQIFTCIQNATV